jgi:hypothetical protein
MPAVVVLLLVTGLLASLPSAAAAATCPSGSSAVTSKRYKITHLDGTVAHVANLAGNVRRGDRIQVSFTLAAGCVDKQVSIASYRATSSTGLPLQNQILFDSDTGRFDAGRHTLALSVRVFGVPAPAGGSTRCTQVANPPGGNGANVPGPYDPTCDGSPSQNGSGTGNATGRPCAGCVGNADAKNPPGQLPNGNDRNAGYECDRNRGVGQTNPAHTGCTAFQVDFVTGSVLAQLGPAGSANTYSAQGRLVDFVNGP